MERDPPGANNSTLTAGNKTPDAILKEISGGSCSSSTTKTHQRRIQKTSVCCKVTMKGERHLGFRTITLRVPLVSKTYYLRPASNIVSKIPSTTSTQPAPRNNFIENLFKTLVVLVCLAVPSTDIYRFICKHAFYANSCDMRESENRDFNKFYGIEHLENPFKRVTADEFNSETIYKPVLPPAILKSDHSANSILLVGKHGTGKTLLRCHYYKYLNSSEYFKILILNQQINEYLERFVKEALSHEKYCETTNCLDRWSENEFGQLLLSVLVTQFVDAYQETPFDLPNISMDQKIDLITILCFYYNGPGARNLENFVNSFLNKTDDDIYRAKNAVVQILERNIYQDKPLLTHLKRELNKLIVLRNDSKNLELLLLIAESEQYQSPIMERKIHDNVVTDLIYLTEFMKKHLKKTVVFIIDGIDENRYLFKERSVHKESLKLFYKSSVSQAILSAVMARTFYLSFFYPEIDGIDQRDDISRNDKFPRYEMNWNTKSLMNYADYLLQGMNKKASRSRCKAFTDFRTLTNYSSEQNANIINRISTPRMLHYFMIELIREMNDCANNVEEPFIATFENIDNAFNNSIQQ
ncbi:unnamed protein product [Rotaria magnacalcarata]